ncbi:LytR/AlgR family response regulator transcription factor [Labilibacter marinus]|uniref:LytR/AlgR family response regulator transcription factor n=1 Tax=Labilibacter marinus TaxID=1477105 RepID=UPI000835A5A7|nr:LytTR family DNA-binding domain-containing protein [Labilibacter marinus]
MISAVIIDDEKDLRALNASMIKDNFPDINIVGEADSVDGGVKLIQDTKPDIVLLDIEIKGGTGFNILQKLHPYNFKLIFITAFNEFAIKAIKFSAMDYILKPVNEYEFIEAIKRVVEQISVADNPVQYNNFLSHYEKKTQTRKLVLRTAEALHLVDVKDIIYCKSDNSYTTFYLNNANHVMVSKSMKEYASILEEYEFVRPHQSFLVNLKYISKIDKSDGGFIILSNGKEIPVSSRRKQPLIQILEQSC